MVALPVIPQRRNNAINTGKLLAQKIDYNIWLVNIQKYEIHMYNYTVAIILECSSYNA